LPWRTPCTPTTLPLSTMSRVTLAPIQHWNDGNGSAFLSIAFRNTGCGIQMA
jgi:hypothetical protein